MESAGNMNLDKKRQKAQEIFRQYAANPIANRPDVADDTKYDCEKALHTWNS